MDAENLLPEKSFSSYIAQIACHEPRFNRHLKLGIRSICNTRFMVICEFLRPLTSEGTIKNIISITLPLARSLVIQLQVLHGVQLVPVVQDTFQVPHLYQQATVRDHDNKIYYKLAIVKENHSKGGFLRYIKIAMIHFEHVLGVITFPWHYNAFLISELDQLLCKSANRL